MASITMKCGKICSLDDEDYQILKKYGWVCCARHSYVGRGIRLQDGRKSILLLHREIMGAKKGQIVDHKDGNPFNNHRSNLRLCTHSQNSANKHTKTGNSPFWGIARTPKGSWFASIRVCGASKYLGLFSTPEEAAMAYDKAAREYFGDFAIQNFKELVK